MSRTEINLTTLTNYCRLMATSDLPYYPELSEYFKVLDMTGCRSSEPFYINRWSFKQNNEFYLQPLKGNNVRTVILDDSVPNFKSAILNQHNPFMSRTISQARNIYQISRKFGELQSEEKSISMYMYRYKFIKELATRGKTDNEIAAIMGYTSSMVVGNYLKSVIYESADDIPKGYTSIGGVLWSNHNLTIDDHEGGVIKIDDQFEKDFGNFYSHEAALRIAAKTPHTRVPTLADFEQMSAFLVSIYKQPQHLLNPSRAYIIDPLAWFENFNGFDARGAGNWRNYQLYNHMHQNSFVLADYDDESRGMYIIGNAHVGYGFRAYPLSYYSSLRLIYDPSI